jgi:hypothetical protein
MADTQAPSESPASQENLLLDYIHRLESHRRGRKAVHVHLSRLLPHHRREHHVRTAANSFDPLVKAQHGQLFMLKNADLFFIYKGEAQADVDTSILKLRFLFNDDPLFSEADGGGEGFQTDYDAETQFEEILRLARGFIHADDSEEKAVDDGGVAKSPFRQKQSQGEPLTPRVLGRVEQALERADISNMVRRQYICGLIGEATPQPLFSELFISIADLKETLMPGVDVGASRWLFQHLTETLDKRVLSMLAKATDRSITGEVSVNLNVSTLLSADFMHFDDTAIASIRGSVVVELQKVDIFADLNAYMFARDFAKERGYRICIDGLTYRSLPFIDRDSLGADMVKLVWESDLAEKVPAEEFQDMVKATGEARIILCRCDDQDAIEFGQANGISMFQGRHIENLIAEESRRRDMEAARRRHSSQEIIE